GNNLSLDIYDMSGVEDGKFLLTGSFYADLSLSNGTTLIGEKLNGSFAGDDIFVLELDTALNIQGTLQAGSNSRDRGMSVTWSNRGTAWLTGDFLPNPTPMFTEPLTFDNVSLTSAGRYDVFITEGLPGNNTTSVEQELEQADLRWYQEGQMLKIQSQDASFESLELYNLQGQKLDKLADRLEPGRTLLWPTKDYQGLLILKAVKAGKMYSQKIYLR
ncbi:MAG: hypothetical protein AAFR59_18125, partial [Bacteroidota bacterium]